MPSKQRGKDRPASLKRAAKQPRMASKTRRFQKDWDRLADSGRDDMSDLRNVMLALIANEAPLSRERRDHALADSRLWRNCRECHIHGDYLLVYQLVHDGEIIFTAVGTHAELGL